jgi:hypothetical protein
VYSYIHIGVIYTIFQIEEDVFMPGVKFVVTMALCPGIELSYFTNKNHPIKTTSILVCGQSIIGNYRNLFKEDYYV